MKNEILSKVDSISQQIIEGICEIVRVPSIKSESKENAPFGQDIRNALDKALEMSDRLGFNSYNLDNKIGYAQYGNQDEYVGVIGHLDVVDIGEGWKNPPFSAYIENNTIYGRGVLDNKGPLFACLYAMYVLKELNIDLKYAIRIVFGCDEETGQFNDLIHYLNKEKPPVMGFTPDCKYPVVYSERGRAILKVSCKSEYIDGLFDFMNAYILNTRNRGERLGIDYENKEFGILELKKYSLQSEDGESRLLVTISYPFGVDCDSLLRQVEKCVEKFEGLNVSIDNTFLPVKFDKDSFMIKCMQNAYEEVTGFDGTPVTTSGGTYAKMMPNIVPFGPSFPGQKDISHNPNEWMTFEDIITNTKIYALALYYLSKK